MRCLTAPAIFKIREKASVFLTELHPALDADARNTVLAKLRKRDFDATHHCSAWREGVPVVAYGADDDGEPNGTAGAPMLRVLEGNDLTGIIAVCIRWFGGTKLGTGGLVRAYTESLQGAIAGAEATGLFEEVRILRMGEIRVSPELAHLPFSVLGAFSEIEITDQSFADNESLVRFTMPPGREAALEAAWQERSRGGSIRWV
jgi:uncharacterized YigZ family protein